MDRFSVTSSPAGQGPDPNSCLVGYACRQSSKTARPVASFRSAYRAWPGANSGLMDFVLWQSSKTARPVASIRSAYGIRFVGRAASPPPSSLDDGTAKIEEPTTDYHRHCEARRAVAISTAAVGCAERLINIENPGYTMLIGANRTDTWYRRLPRPCGARNDGGCG